MPFPASRITDPTSAGCIVGVIVLGYPTVLIGCLPASRVTDLHTCLCLAFVPSPIAMGSTTVLTGCLPQARLTDQCICGGKIVMGCPTVLVG